MWLFVWLVSVLFPKVGLIINIIYFCLVCLKFPTVRSAVRMTIDHDDHLPLIFGTLFAWGYCHNWNYGCKYTTWSKLLWLRQFITPFLNSFFWVKLCQDYRRQTSWFGDIVLMYFKPIKTVERKNNNLVSLFVKPSLSKDSHFTND